MHHFNALKALIRVAGYGTPPLRLKKAYSQGDITRLIDHQLDREGINQSLAAEGLDIPRIDWGQLFMVALAQQTRKLELSQTQREDFLADVVSDMILGQSISGLRDTGPWKLNLAEQIGEWVRDGFDENRIKATLTNWIKNKIYNIYRRYLAEVGPADIGFQRGAPQDDGGFGSVYEELFSMDELTPSRFRSVEKILRDREVAALISRMTAELSRRDDRAGYVWQAYISNPSATGRQLMEIPVEATIEGRRVVVPLWEALGFDGPDESRQRINYQVNQARKEIQKLWPQIKTVLERIKMSFLQENLIRLGSKNPHLRNHIRPVLDVLTREASAPNQVLNGISKSPNFTAVTKGGDAILAVVDEYKAGIAALVPERASSYIDLIVDREFWNAFNAQLGSLLERNAFKTFGPGKVLDSAIKKGLNAADKELFNTVHIDIYGSPARGKRDWDKFRDASTLGDRYAFDGVIEDEDWDHAPANWRGYLVSMTYETWDEESIDIGETDDKGWYSRDDEMETLSEVASYLYDYIWLGWSSSNPNSTRDWLISEGEVDYRTGETTNYNAFIRRADGKPLSRREMDYLKRKLRLR